MEYTDRHEATDEKYYIQFSRHFGLINIYDEQEKIRRLELMYRLRGIEQRLSSYDDYSEYADVFDVKAYIQDLVDSKCNVSTIAAMDGWGYAFYPTNLLPHYNKMVPSWIPEVLKEAHERDIKLICWNVFNVQDVGKTDDFQIAKHYPEWKMEFIEDKTRTEAPPENVGMCVISSPYLQQHAMLLKEVAALGG